MNKYLPSKQFVKTIGITLLGGAALFFLGNFLSKQTVWEQKRTSSPIVAFGAEGDYFSRDSDGDGLYDWEEALWGTNPNSKDSRGDGISDHDYVKNLKSQMEFDDEYTPNLDNDTEVFARQLFATSAVLNQSGTLSQDDIERFNSGLEMSMNNFNIKDKYTLSNLKMSNISPLEYSQKIDSLYESLGELDINELSLIAYMAENPNDPDALVELGEYLKYSEKLINGYLNMNVPHNIAGTHLSIVNNIYKISEITKQAYYLDSDPLRAIMYLGKYDEYTDNLISGLDALANYFASNGII
jgi:hypothetical protein